MSEAAQREIVAFLSDPKTHGGATVETITTHASIVFLAGDRVFKLKRAVKYSYLRQRVGARKNDASDADLAVLEKQLGYDLGPMDWHRIDASADPNAVAEAAKKAIKP